MRIHRALLLCLFSGCALFSKNDPMVTRYFTPEAELRPSAHLPQTSEMRLRLGRVSAAAHLRERMVVVTAQHELRFHDDRRWAERPETYLRRALSRAFFEERGFVHVISGSAPTLEVDLAAFEEIEQSNVVRLRVTFILHDERVGQLEETLTVEEPLRRADPTEQAVAVAGALSRTLRAGVESIADRVTTRLAALSASARSEPASP
jgi:uncharacterized lipoprotein YmbA